MCLGRPFSDPCSIKSKSKTKFRAAIATTKRLKPIPIKPLEWIKPIPDPPPKTIIPIFTIYRRAIPAVALTIISLKFSVGFMIPVL